LSHLARNSRRTVSRTELMDSVWSDAPSDTGERTVDVHVRRLRTKLGRYRKLISTVRGAGYRLDPGSAVAILGCSGALRLIQQQGTAGPGVVGSGRQQRG